MVSHAVEVAHLYRTMDGNRSSIERTPIRNQSIGFHDHEYYGPLIESYIRSVLNSGLLLDEDLEVLLSIAKFRNFSEQSSYRPSLSLIASLVSIVASFYVARRYQSSLVAVPSVIIAAKTVTSEVVAAIQRKDNKEIVNRLIEIISKVHKLNVGVIRYMRTRIDLGKAKGETFLTLYSRSLQEFLDTLSRSSPLQFMMDNLRDISSQSDALHDDYKSFENLEFTNLFNDENVTSIENCLAFTQRLQNLHVFFASKLLSYIGVILYSKSSRFREQDLRSLINRKLPRLITRLQIYHDETKKLFVTLRQSVKRKTEYKSQARETGKKQVSAKLQETLVYSVNNLSIILEKSQNVMDRIESGDENVGNAIIDLKSHTYATYESLDLLCKLYGILSNSTIGKPNECKVLPAAKTDKASEGKLPRVNYDDDTEPLEEKFELYVGEEDDANEYPSTSYVEDQSGAYLTLMLQELKQSLKQHQRFIDAKNRRGSEDDEMDKIAVVELKKSPPKFNLNALKDECEQRDVCEADKEIPGPPIELPMPPPPPPPSFSLSDLEEEPGRVNARSMLDNIKALSSQREMQEDVFGDSDIDSNCSD